MVTGYEIFVRQTNFGQYLKSDADFNVSKEVLPFLTW
jgi:hypothetical protein